jgi:hypothetical protein
MKPFKGVHKLKGYFEEGWERFSHPFLFIAVRTRQRRNPVRETMRVN